MTFWNDVRLAARLLLKDKWFTLAAVAALALGIAANNTVFTIVNGVLLRDLPFEDPDRIVSVGVRTPPGAQNPLSGVSYADARDWAAAVRTFDGIAAFTEQSFNISEEGPAPQRFRGAFISANTFGLMIIGVVSDGRERPDGEIQRSFYLPIDAGGFSGNLVLLLRSDRKTADVLTAARGVLAQVDPQVAAYDAASLEEILKHSAAAPRLYGFVALWCALLALALAAIGLYGVLAYSVGSRTHEFGVRIALGAEATAVRWQVLRQGLLLSLVGLALGLAGGYAASQTLSSLLFGVTPGDLTTFAIAASLLMMTAIAACLVPSIRATRVDPVVALRAE